MADLVYRSVMRDIKHKILQNQYAGMRLPDERSLSETYGVSRSSIKRALGILAQQGIIFKKRGSGTFINPLYLKNQSLFHYEGSNLGITDSFQVDGKKQGISLLDYQVVPASADIQEELFLNDNDFVYQIKRLRLIDDQPFMIETGFIPIKIVTKSFTTISVSPSIKDDQDLLKLTPTEPVGVMDGVFFLDDGTPFEVSNMRIHYKYMRYSTFINLDQEG